MSSEPAVGTGDVGDVGEVVRFDGVDHGPHARVVHVVGEIDTLTAPLLQARLDEHLVVTLLVLDLSDVTFLGSAGLAVLVAAKDDADRRSNTLRLVCGSRIVMRAGGHGAARAVRRRGRGAGGPPPFGLTAVALGSSAEASGCLVAPAVFKTDVAEHLGQAGSIPVRLRH